MIGSRLLLLALCCGGVGAMPGCTEIAGLGGEYRHVATGGVAGASGGSAGAGGSGAGAGKGSAAAGGDSGDGGDAGGDSAGTGGSVGGTSAGAGGSSAGAGGSSAGTSGNTMGAGGEGGELGGVGGTAGMAGSAGSGASWTGPVRIGYSEFHDSSSGTDSASAYQPHATFEIPAGTEEGDLMLLFFGSDHSLDITNQRAMETGWMLLDAQSDQGTDGQGTYLLYRFASAAEPDPLVFMDVNPSLNGIQGLLSVYRAVNRTAPVNDYKVAKVYSGTEGPSHIDTPTPEVTTTVPNCLLLAGLSPDSAIDSPVVSSWPAGFPEGLSVKNLPFPTPFGWANIYLSEQPWATPGAYPVSSFGWEIAEPYHRYYGAISFVLALAPGP